MSPDFEYFIVNGSTVIAETNTSLRTNVSMLTSNVSSILIFTPSVTSYTFFIVIRTSLETGKKGLCESVAGNCWFGDYACHFRPL
jgi:hypothetical protein